MVRFSDILRKSEKKEPAKPKREEPRKEPEKREVQREKPKPSGEEQLKAKAGAKEEKSRQIYSQMVELAENTLTKAGEGKVIKRKDILGIINEIIDQLGDSNQELLLVLTQARQEASYPVYLPYHLANVCILAINLGLELEYDRMKLLELGISGFLHDIGMLRVPQEIMNKPSRLSDGEFAEVKRHSGHALDMLKKSEEISEPVQEAVYQHHELANGEGYPQGLKGDKICEYAKIIGMVNMYEALTSPRIYRDKVTPKEALAMIVDTERRMTPHEAIKTTLTASEDIFVSATLKLFVKQMTIYPTGSFVKLNNDEVGFVIRVNKEFPMKPAVNVIFDSQGTKLGKPKVVDLAKSPLLYIQSPVVPLEYR